MFQLFFFWPYGLVIVANSFIGRFWVDHSRVGRTCIDDLIYFLICVTWIIQCFTFIYVLKGYEVFPTLLEVAGCSNILSAEIDWYPSCTIRKVTFLETRKTFAHIVSNLIDTLRWFLLDSRRMKNSYKNCSFCENGWQRCDGFRSVPLVHSSLSTHFPSFASLYFDYQRKQ